MVTSGKVCLSGTIATTRLSVGNGCAGGDEVRQTQVAKGIFAPRPGFGGGRRADDVIIGGQKKMDFPYVLNGRHVNLDESEDLSDPLGVRPLSRVRDPQGPDTWARVAAAPPVRRCASGAPVERRGESTVATSAT